MAFHLFPLFMIPPLFCAQGIPLFYKNWQNFKLGGFFSSARCSASPEPWAMAHAWVKMTTLFPFAETPVVGVLDEPYSAKSAQRSSHTSPPGYKGWKRYQPKTGGPEPLLRWESLADYKPRLKLPPQECWKSFYWLKLNQRNRNAMLEN